MNILLIGANGFIGRSIVNSSIVKDHNITICTRGNNKDADNQHKQYHIDFNQMLSQEAWLPYLKGINLVINAVGIISQNKNSAFNLIHTLAPIALFKACETKNIRVIHFSALGVERAKVDFQKSKKIADDYLINSQLDYFILRPSIIYNGKSFRFFRFLSNLPMIFLIDGGKQNLQLTTIEEVLNILNLCIKNKTSNRVMNIAGNMTTYQQFMLQIREKEYRPFFVSISFKRALFLIHFLHRFSKFISADNLYMLQDSKAVATTNHSSHDLPKY